MGMLFATFKIMKNCYILVVDSNNRKTVVTYNMETSIRGKLIKRKNATKILPYFILTVMVLPVLTSWVLESLSGKIDIGCQTVCPMS